MRSVNLTGRFSPKPDRGGFCFSSPHLINRREFVDICIVEGRNRGYHRVDTPAAVPNQGLATDIDGAFSLDLVASRNP